MINIINKKEARSVSIQQCLNGYIVTVGCTTVVFNSLDSLVNELKEYLNAPYEYEEKMQIQRGYRDEPQPMMGELVNAESRVY